MHLLDRRRRSPILDTDPHCFPDAQVRREKYEMVRSLVPRPVSGSAAGPTVGSFPLRQEQNPVDPRVHFATLRGMVRRSASVDGPERTGSTPVIAGLRPAPPHRARAQSRRRRGPATPTEPETTRNKAGFDVKCSSRRHRMGAGLLRRALPAGAQGHNLQETGSCDSFANDHTGALAGAEIELTQRETVEPVRVMPAKEVSTP